MMSPRIARFRPANGQPRLLRFVSTPEVDALMSGPPAMSRIAWSRFGAVVCRIGSVTTRPQARRRLRLQRRGRSEEHTSELQSRGHLVCRLLLEKKKKKQ